MDPKLFETLMLKFVLMFFEATKTGNQKDPEFVNMMVENLQKAFLEAARVGNQTFVDSCSTIIGEMVNAAESPLFGETALHIAAQNGHRDIVLTLLNHPLFKLESCFIVLPGKEDDVADEAEFTLPSPLLLASKEGHLEVVEAIMDFISHRDPPIQLHPEMYTEPLKWALRCNHTHVVEFLVRHPLVLGKDTLDRDGYSLLHLAAHLANLPILSLLLESGLLMKGENKGLLSKDGLTPLHLAAQSSCTDVAKLLLKYFSKYPSACLSLESTPEGFTPLHFAANSGHLDMVSLLLISIKDAGVNPFVATDCMGRTALHYAAREGHHLVVQKLLEFSEFNVDMADWDGLTPLHMAARSGHAKVIEELLSSSTHHLHARARHSANLKRIFNLAFATEQKFYATKSYFPRPKLIDSMFWMTEGFTPMHFAARYGQVEALAELLKHFSTSSSSSTNSSCLDKLDLRDSAGFRAYEWAKVRNQEDKFLEYVELHIVNGVQKLMNGSCVSVERRNLKIARRDVSEEDKEMEKLEHPWEKNPPICVERLELFMDESLMMKPHGLHLGLHWAALRNSVDRIRTLLAKEDVDVNERDVEGFTPLDRAIKTKNLGGRIKTRYLGAAAELLKHPRVELNHKLAREVIFLLVMMSPPKNVRVPMELYVMQLMKREDVQVATCHNLDWLLCWAITNNMDKLAMQLISIDMTNCTQKLVFYSAEERDFKTVRPFDVAKEKGQDNLVELMLQRQDVKVAMYEDTKVYLDCENAIMVGGALIAGVAYQGWLQPPQGYSFEYQYIEYANVEKSWPMVLFWWCNSFAFFFSIATVIAGVVGAVPIDTKDILESVNKARRALIVSCIMFCIALLCVMLSFFAAGLAVVPPLHQPRQIMWVSVSIGASVCILILLWFLLRFQTILPRFRRSQKFMLFNQTISKEDFKFLQDQRREAEKGSSTHFYYSSNKDMNEILPFL